MTGPTGPTVPGGVPGQGDLLDLLAAEASAAEAAATGGPSPLEVAHMVLPNMALACGRDLLEVTRAAAAAHATEPVPEAGEAAEGETRRRPRLLTYSPEHTTCPDCQAAGDLHALAAAMQHRQAPTT
ncbi:hypothetical protein [Kineosporia sp. A_224]|uniref:hypothetical protein n=1 Tax=Kineosporia sp. A_224 TaxID=1962180 RepID=UPI001179AA6C|nr:hypothetical protein [Kineosporia sp. A_224]